MKPRRNTLGYVLLIGLVAALAGLPKLLERADSRPLGRLSTTGVQGFAAIAGTLALLAMFFTATFVAQWFDELVRRATRRVRAEARPGYGIFQGVARAAEGGTDATLVQSTRVEVGTPGEIAVWDREVTARPFRLVLDTGEELEVLPEQPIVDGFDVDAQPHGVDFRGRPKRFVIARLRDGERVWVTGVLGRPRSMGAGAYRQIQELAHLRPRKGEPMVLSKELPAARWRDRARAHRFGAFAALAATALLHVPSFAFDRTLARTSSLTDASTQLPRGTLLFACGAVAAAAYAWLRLVRASRRRFGGT